MLFALLSLTVPSILAKPLEAAGESSLSGVVEVPLYAGFSSTDVGWYVELSSGETTLFMRLAAGDADFELSAAAAGRLGLKLKGKEGEQTASLDSASLGGVSLSDIDVTIGKPKMSGNIAVDGEIGLAAFPELSWLILPSEGVVRIGAADASFTGTLGTQAISFTRADPDKVKIAGHSTDVKAAPFLVPVQISGATVNALLSFGGPSWLAREAQGVDWYSVKNASKEPISLPAAPAYSKGEFDYEWRTVSVGGINVDTHVVRKGLGPVYLFQPNLSVIGQDVLHNMDIAIDAGAQKIAFREVSAPKLKDYSATYEARLRKALEPAADADADAQKAARLGGIPALSSWLVEHGKFEEAATLYREVVDDDPSTCTTWMSLGDYQLAAGRSADAVKSYQQAMDLYLPWAARPLKEREKLSKSKARADKAGREWTSAVPQDHACHVAPGKLAHAYLAEKNYTAIAQLYPSRLDLDGGLAMAAGSAALMQGRMADAEAAYRQAIKLNSITTSSANARIGLMLATAARSWETAAAQVDTYRLANDQGVTDFLAVRLLLQAGRSSGHGADALALLRKLVEADPENAVLLSQLAIELSRDGAADAGAALTRAEQVFARELQARPTDATLWAAQAQLLLSQGKLDDARAAATKATQYDPGQALGWLALSDVESAAGNTEKATENLRHAGMVATGHPGYVVLLAQ